MQTIPPQLTPPIPRAPFYPVQPPPAPEIQPDSFVPDGLGKLARGAGSALAGALVEGVGMAGITLYHTPKAVQRAYHDLWTSEHGMAFKGGWSVGIPALAALATPLAGVIGVAYGGYAGALEGYQHGFTPSMGDCLASLKQFHQLVGDTITYEPKAEIKP